jgi:hypothetical protein
MITMVLLVTNSVVSGMGGQAQCGDEGGSCGCTEVLVFFITHFLSQASQNITVEDRVDCSVRRNKFTANNPLHG